MLAVEQASAYIEEVVGVPENSIDYFFGVLGVDFAFCIRN